MSAAKTKPATATSPNPLALSIALTEHTRALCQGLEDGSAEILHKVTPHTADLLHWWFSDEMCTARGSLNFHAGQKQAILNTIVAHEVLESSSLLDLYEQVAPHALTGARRQEVAQPKHDHPKYCLKMATGTGKTWVMQALMVWQVLNRNAAQAEGVDDPRFTRRFLVVAPGLIVYERLLDAFCGRLIGSGRDFSTSDIARNAELFIPETQRDSVLAFVRGNVCAKGEIGLKATGNGMIALTNWHLLNGVDDEANTSDTTDDASDTPAPLEAHRVIDAVLPLTPGRAAGNSLDMLDRRYARGDVLEYLSALPDLMVFNDEAHHIHELRREGEATEVEWQKSLSRIAEPKGQRFVQVDFSATPYNDVGTPKNRRKVYFPHIVTDFDLRDAMRAGLVKSLVLDRRKEVGALPLDFTVERDDKGRAVELSAGQRVMLRAGLMKLRKLETDFAKIDPTRHPKMLVVCEDTTVSPLVARFLTEEEGLAEDAVMSVDSGKKAELGEKDWAAVRERLFSVDHHATPRVIVSVLMLREGFDVNNICVIVPLRSSQAQILLEQTIGRGLRLMWRDREYDEIKADNRQRINNGQEPGSLLDVLTIVEHPAFNTFYQELMDEKLAGATTEQSDRDTSTGDLMAARLREGFEAFDFAIPFILQEADEVIAHNELEVSRLPAFTAMSREQLVDLLGRGDQFISQDLQSSTLFGDYRVDGAVMTVSGYNDYLSRLTRRIGQSLSQPLPKGNKIAHHLDLPYLQVNTAALTGWLDDYIWSRLFDAAFNPHDGENWRVLLLKPVIDHLTRIFGHALREAAQSRPVGETEVRHRRLSEVRQLLVRESSSVEVGKCIYPRLPYPARSGGLEKRFIHWAQADSHIEAFCKISETRHDFMRLRYVKEDGLPAFYSPDFLVRTADAIHLVETKAQQQVIHPDVQRKRRAAVAWCERINALPADVRADRHWSYVLLGEDLVDEWQGGQARLADLLRQARCIAAADATRQFSLI